MPKTLRLILGDQLNHQHTWYNSPQDGVSYVLMEMRQETDYVKHHIQKVIAFFLAMRSFADTLRSRGHEVIYLSINDASNVQSLEANLNALIARHGFEHFEYQLPDEYRLDRQLHTFCEQLTISWQAHDTEHFLTKREDLKQFFKGKKTYLMESFYRNMRQKHAVLMQDGQPIGEKWNFDHENRNKLPKQINVPSAWQKTKHLELTKIKDEIAQAGITSFGSCDDEDFCWPTTREEALEAMRYFIDHLLPNFGLYQDAMHTAHSKLWHSLLSFALNVKLLQPLELVKAVEAAYHQSPDRYPLAAVEGYIRQVIGWREYMRGVYWAKMPEYAALNYFNHQNKLPDFYWTGRTKMNCLKHAIEQSLSLAYAHHIQRLMVTGNFALLAMVHPDEVDAWYLGVYIDAIEWVEITNTRGMSQFADGGIVGTKPYVSSANYIDKMSNYCGSCHYDKSKRVGQGACPFNSLYWHFYAVHRDKLEKNPRIGMMYRTWDKMDTNTQSALMQQAQTYLAQLDQL
jgi:deoxyribodipyrimidine photolyase-related protein